LRRRFDPAPGLDDIAGRLHDVVRAGALLG
jgi:hypothetical protein